MPPTFQSISRIPLLRISKLMSRFDPRHPSFNQTTKEQGERKRTLSLQYVKQAGELKHCHGSNGFLAIVKVMLPEAFMEYYQVKYIIFCQHHSGRRCHSGRDTLLLSAVVKLLL